MRACGLGKVRLPPETVTAIVAAAYIENDYPSDRLKGDWPALLQFAEACRERGADLDPMYLGNVVERLRKNGRLARVGRRFKGPVFGRK